MERRLEIEKISAARSDIFIEEMKIEMKHEREERKL